MENPAERVWNMAKMQRQIKHFDPRHYQLRMLKIHYLKLELDGLNEITALERDYPEQKERHRAVVQKVVDAHEAFKAIRRL